MKGLIVKTMLSGENDKLEVAIPDGSVSVSIEMTRYAATVGVGGLTKDDVHVSWKGGDLYVGDEIQVEFADIEESPLPVWQETHASLVERMVAISKKDDEEVWQRKLEQYYRLKAILEAENLI